MAVEARRGCGYRKVGGTYLVGGGIGQACDRLPFELVVCPCCSAGIKPSLGWTWIRPGLLFQGPHTLRALSVPKQTIIYKPIRQIIETDGDPRQIKEIETLCEDRKRNCWLCENPGQHEKAGLVWIGERFYKTPEEFLSEGRSQGFSRRIKAVPHGFKVGETPIFLAHKKAIAKEVHPTESNSDALLLKGEDGGTEIVYKPGIFYVWIPSRIEKIFKESERESEEVKAAEKRDIVPVFVPDGDLDHRGTVYDKEE